MGPRDEYRLRERDGREMIFKNFPTWEYLEIGVPSGEPSALNEMKTLQDEVSGYLKQVVGLGSGVQEVVSSPKP